LILYGIMTVVRQLIEPRLLGKNLGIHPFATLFTMYAGLRLFGFAGLILSPVVVFVLKELRQSKKASAP
jgi:predicted PurR-regulated permease PerM